MQGVEWPDKVKERALALCIQTGNISEASRLLAAELGEGSAPPIRTVNVWVHKTNPELYQSIAETKRAIVQERWLDLELAALDSVEGKIASGEIDAKDTAIVAGISADKRIAIETLNARFKGGNRAGLFRIMERIEGEMRSGKTGSRILEGVYMEGEMP